MSRRENAVMLRRLERETDVLLYEEDTEIAALGEFHDGSFDFGDHVGLNASVGSSRMRILGSVIRRERWQAVVAAHRREVPRDGRGAW